MACLAAPWAQAELRTRRVLIIHSFGRDVAPFDAVAAAFRLNWPQREPGRWCSSTPAWRRAPARSAPDEEAIFAAYLKARFGEPLPDLVATVGGAAAAFVLQQRDAIFPACRWSLMGIDARVAPASV